MIIKAPEWGELIETNQQLTTDIGSVLNGSLPTPYELPVDRFGRRSYAEFHVAIGFDGLKRASAQRYILRSTPTDKQQTNAGNIKADSIPMLKWHAFGVQPEGQDGIDELVHENQFRMGSLRPDYLYRRAAAVRLHEVRSMLVAAQILESNVVHVSREDLPPAVLKPAA